MHTGLPQRLQRSVVSMSGWLAQYNTWAAAAGASPLPAAAALSALGRAGWGA